MLGVDISLSSPLAKGFLEPLRVEISVDPTKQGGLEWVGTLQTLWSRKVLAITIYLVYTSWKNFVHAFPLPFTKCLLYYYSIVTFLKHDLGNKIVQD